MQVILAPGVSLTPADSLANVIQAAADAITLTLKGFSGQTQPLLAAQDSSGATVAKMAADGSLQIGSASPGAGERLYLTTTPTGSTSVNGAQAFVSAAPISPPGAGTIYNGAVVLCQSSAGLSTDMTNANVTGLLVEAFHRGTAPLGTLIAGDFRADVLNTGIAAENRCLSASLTIAGNSQNSTGDAYGLRVNAPVFAGGATQHRVFGVAVDDQSNAGLQAHCTQLLLRKISLSRSALNNQIECQGGGLSLWEAGFDDQNVMQIRQNSGTQTGYLFQCADVTGNTGLVTVDGGGNLVFGEGKNLSAGTTTGTKLGVTGGAAGEKWGFFGHAPITQPLLATGAGHTVDDILSVLQSLGLCRQA